MICSTCGKQTPDESVFCQHCGAQAKPPAPPQPTGYQNAQQPIHQQPQPLGQQQQPVQQTSGSQPPAKKPPLALILGISAAALLIISLGGFFGIRALIRRANPTPNVNTAALTPDKTPAPPAPSTPEKPATQEPKKQRFDDYRGYAGNETPSIGDFFWFTEDVKWDKAPEGRVALTDFRDITGYWKAYTETISTFQGEPESHEWYNAEISGDVNQATFTYHTKGFTGFDSQTGDYDLSRKDGEHYSGHFSAGQLVVGDVATKGVKITVSEFYSFDGKQYALAQARYVSGEKEYIVLVRP